jgi:alpha-D-ribose 1-methylphosphonate 5-triphosphate synthase subunit PhnH
MMLQTLMTSAPGAGLNDPVMDGQSVFRTVMTALAEPGIVRALDADILASLDSLAGLTPAATAMLLALADFETPVWLESSLSTPEIISYLRFHAGCPIVNNPGKAQFAVIADSATLSSLDGFAIGSLDYPDRSATLLVQVETLGNGPTWRLTGPGIAATREVQIAPVNPALAGALAQNRAHFPCGVDIIFTDGVNLMGLPRSTTVTEA